MAWRRPPHASCAFLAPLLRRLFLSADLLIMILCLLIARGWRVTSATFSPGEQRAVIAGCTAYISVYAIVYCVDVVQRDPADEVYPLMTGGPPVSAPFPPRRS